MHVVIPVFFRAPLGGLQAHVRAQALALCGAGHGCTVLCKPGPFANELASLGVEVVETDFASPDGSADRVDHLDRVDLVHAHPFASRRAGLEIARRRGVPFVLTLHGQNLDGLASYADRVHLVIAVSPAVRDLAVAQEAADPQRVVVIPNGVDTRTFRPLDGSGPHDDPANREAIGQDRRILFASRLDEDKRTVLDMVSATWREMMRTRAFDLHWWIAGDGTCRAEMEARAAELDRAAVRRLVEFCGWLPEQELARFYNRCHLCVAPGRCALDCLACATPVVAVGSRGYVGLLDEQRCLDGMHGNFGGWTGRAETWPGAMFEDIDSVVYDDERLARLGHLGQRLVASWFSQDEMDRRLLACYRLIAGKVPAEAADRAFVRIEREAFGFADPAQPDRLAPGWSFQQGEDRRVEILPGGIARVSFRLAEADKFYLTNDAADFSRPPRDEAGWAVRPSTRHRLRVDLAVRDGDPSVQGWLIAYGEAERTGHAVRALHPGANWIDLTTSPGDRSCKVAFRFSGSGQVLIRPFELHEMTAPGPRPEHDPRRLPAADAFGAYQGENLVFVLGPPRSGTTWVLGLLAAHPEVVAATVDNLEARFNPAPTLETNVFNDNRPFTDNQLKRRFHRLSLAHPGKTVVEKTPVHLLFTDRIRRVFPRAALVLVDRDVRDTVASLVQVGRDPEAWWEGAPDTVEKAARLWMRYHEAATRCRRLHRPLEVRYEELLDDTPAELGALLQTLGLSTAHLEDQIASCHRGKNIPIPGVFRQGRKGTWRDLLDADDLATLERITGRRIGEWPVKKKK